MARRARVRHSDDRVRAGAAERRGVAPALPSVHLNRAATGPLVSLLAASSEEENMQARKRVGAIVLLVICMITAAGRRAQMAEKADPKDMVSQVRKELMRLPYYGVFDFLAFSVNGSTVTLGGEVYNATIKRDAEREVKRIQGVENVVNNIEVLPVSPFDDDIRWAAFRAIYHDNSLSRYLPGGGWVPRGRMWNFNRPFDAFPGGSRFPGQEPVGNYPIHIIVKGGHIVLEGVVGNQGDKNLAGIRARGVSGAFSVDNELQVEK
jgi:hyperosmotically inducible protein